MMKDISSPELYLVSPPKLKLPEFADQLRAAFAGGPITCFQLWMPEADEARIRESVDLLMPITHQAGAAFVLNGNVKLARDPGCDGVHFDAACKKDIKEARSVLGSDAIIGASCGASRHLSMELAEAGADYVSFGPVFDTRTKNLPANSSALETLGWWAEMMEVPCVAVGGITPGNVQSVKQTGCEFICAVSAVWSAPDGPEAAVRAFHEAMSGRAGSV